MSEEPRPFSTYADMMSKVGRFMFYWSLLEQQLKNSIEDARARLQLKPVKVKGTLVKRLDVWEELAVQLPENVDKAAIASEVRLQTLALKHIRNQIVHGLCGGSSDPDDGEAHIMCIEGGHRIRLVVEDRVHVEVTPYDLPKGRIIYRERTPGQGPGVVRQRMIRR